MYASPILEHFRKPRNVGIADPCTHSYLERDNPWRIPLLMSLNLQGGVIRQARFRSKSCVTAVAAASVVTTMIEGKPVEYARGLSAEGVSDILGGVPAEKMHCCFLVLATLRKALETPHPDSDRHQNNNLKGVLP